MCFVSVEGQVGTYKHVAAEFMHTIVVNKAKLKEIADLLGVPDSVSSEWKPGKLLVVNDSGKAARVKKA